METAKEISKLMQQLMEKYSISEQWLADKIGMSRPTVGIYKLGKQIPKLDVLQKIFKELTKHCDLAGKDKEYAFENWMKAWLKDSTSDLEDADKKMWDSIIAKIPATSEPISTVKTLENFPEAFLPLTIICGDRREVRPRNLGDIFAYSLSMTDIMYLTKLNFSGKDVRIVSDKLVASMDKNDLVAEFGDQNLFVIGSPAVNIAAREINRNSFFRFVVRKEMKRFEEALKAERRLSSSIHLECFWDMVRDPEKMKHENYVSRFKNDQFLNASDADIQKTQIDPLKALIEKLSETLDHPRDIVKSVLYNYRRPGLIDPLDKSIHGLYTMPTNDFGVLSIAKHPYTNQENDFVAVFAAGIHGPGTAGAIKMLLNKDKLKTHPLGGILEVRINELKQWNKRFEEAVPEWQTCEGGGYTESTLENKIRQLKDGVIKSIDSIDIYKDEWEGCFELFKKYSGR